MKEKAANARRTLADELCKYGYTITHAEVRRLCYAGAISVNGIQVKNWAHEVEPGDTITICRKKEMVVP